MFLSKAFLRVGKEVAPEAATPKAEFASALGCTMVECEMQCFQAVL